VIRVRRIAGREASNFQVLGEFLTILSVKKGAGGGEGSFRSESAVDPGARIDLGATIGSGIRGAQGALVDTRE